MDSQLCSRRGYVGELNSPLVLAAPAAQVREETDDDDERCGAAIPGHDGPWIAVLNIADDPVPGKHNHECDQSSNNKASSYMTYLQIEQIARSDLRDDRLRVQVLEWAKFI